MEKMFLADSMKRTTLQINSNLFIYKLFSCNASRMISYMYFTINDIIFVINTLLKYFFVRGNLLVLCNFTTMN